MNKDFKPYIPAGKVISEMTLTSIILGLLLAVIFGAANAYLGLRVGMTVSASIPAAVISMTIIRIIMKRDSILENNMVQTIGSAGESLAAGAIFTMPALFLWAREGVMEGNLPWVLIFIGASISVAIRLLGASALATAMGIYLPFEVSAAIIVGGLIRLAVDKKNKNADNESSQGIIFCSGLIAGEGLIGIILAVFSILDITDKIDLSAYFSAGWIGSIALFIALIIAIYRTAAKN